MFLAFLQFLVPLRAPRLIMVTILTRMARIDSNGMPLGRIVRIRILGRLEWAGRLGRQDLQGRLRRRLDFEDCLVIHILGFLGRVDLLGFTGWLG